MGRAVLAAVVFVSACAVADKPQIGGHVHGDAGPGGITHVDSDVPQLDSFIPADAPPGVREKTLTQTVSETLAAGNSVACPAANGDPGTAENHYYRVFDLASFGITGAFTTETVTFQVEDCESVAGNGTTVDVNVGTYAGTAGGTTLDPTQITVLQSATGVQVPEVDESQTTPPTTPGATINAPLAATIPAGSKIVVELVAPDGDLDHQFYIGTNKSAETAPGYVSATSCTPPGATPTSVSSLSPGVSILLTVTGTY